MPYVKSCESENRVTGYPDLVLSAQVGSPVPGVQVVCAIDLDV
jgi:hypothetical protein